MTQIKISKLFAYICGPLHLVVLSNKSGYRVSLNALPEFEKSKFHPQAITVNYNNEIIWVSLAEAKEHSLKEVSVPLQEYEG